MGGTNIYNYDSNLQKKREMARDLFDNASDWTDLYDNEEISNKVLRRMTRFLSYFNEGINYTLHFSKGHVWAENYALLGLTFLECNDEEYIYKTIDKLETISSGDYWGLPVDWHTGHIVIKKNSIMSTTTSEIILFFYEYLKKYSETKYKKEDLLLKPCYAMVNTLNKEIDTPEELQFSYSSYPGVPVNNSNLLIAAAFCTAGDYCNDNYLFSLGLKVLHSTLSCLADDGGITYFRNYDIVDAYHQIFCIRALLYLQTYDNSAKEYLKLAIQYFENAFIDETGVVFVRQERKMIDLMASSEALRLYKKLGDKGKYDKVYRHIKTDLIQNGKFIQRIWIQNGKTYRAKTCFVRQGIARFVLGL